MKTIRITIILFFALLLLAFVIQSVSASEVSGQAEKRIVAAPPLFPAESELVVPLQQAVTTTTLQAASGATIEFVTQNGETVNKVPPQTFDIPHLVLYEDGALTPAVSRTLIMTVTDIEVPLAGATVTLKVETQHCDPDKGGSCAVAPAVPAWNEPRWISNTWGITQTNVVTTFVLEFTSTVISGSKVISTPTDYFRYVVEVNGIPQFNPIEYAFLMENQLSAPLFDVGSQHYDILVYYCDMFDLQGTTRAQATRLITQSVVLAAQEVFDTIANDWGWGPMHPDWDSNGVVEVMIGDGSEWFHLPSKGDLYDVGIFLG